MGKRNEQAFHIRGVTKDNINKNHNETPFPYLQNRKNLCSANTKHWWDYTTTETPVQIGVRGGVQMGKDFEKQFVFSKIYVHTVYPCSFS